MLIPGVVGAQVALFRPSSMLYGVQNLEVMHGQLTHQWQVDSEPAKYLSLFSKWVQSTTYQKVSDVRGKPMKTLPGEPEYHQKVTGVRPCLVK